MARTVKGKITDKATGQPVEGALVKAFDENVAVKDEKMGEAFTDSAGNYEIHYENKRWDEHAVGTKWRPDIYVTVSMLTDGGLVKVKQSKTYEDHKLRDDLVIDLSVPAPNQHARTVWGQITYKDGGVAAGVQVDAYDSDPNNPFTPTPDHLIPANRPAGLRPEIFPPEDDEYMNSATTDANGNYKIVFQDRRWDLSATTAWRPDIYIIVSGQAPNSPWLQGLGMSKVQNNVRLAEGVRIDLTVERPIVVT